MRKALRLTSIGFERAPKLNFSDDGNYFFGYAYKGVPVSYLRHEDEIYLTFRLDYMQHDKVENEPDTWKYNGVDVESIDMKELKEYADKIAEFAKANNYSYEF